MKNHDTKLIKGDICGIPSEMFPECDGIIGVLAMPVLE